ncbi:MAG: efflux RND transporter periplasmic adaptor subunit, partial [Bacteroidota bacterium]|nr:efflux RND transporter periplasmic adaptor subunit [Bacteroidota bacterium]
NHKEDLLILAPFKAVVEQMGEYFVFVVNDSSKVSQRKIQLGTKLNDKIIVKEGLAEGEKIVVDGVQKLKDGSSVALAPAKGK